MSRGTGPSWDRLFERAVAQEGHFTTRQAEEAGYSPQLLAKYLRGGKIARVRRGVYRIVHYPAGEHEDLVAVWLWAAREGVFSHATALALHGLSDVLPSRVHLTLPASWRGRRLRAPEGVVVHHADVPVEERDHFGPVPATSVSRTLADCARAALSPELLRHAAGQALRRGLVDERDLRPVERALAVFEGAAGERR